MQKITSGPSVTNESAENSTFAEREEEIFDALCSGAGYAGTAQKCGFAVTDLYAWLVADRDRANLCKLSREWGFDTLSKKALRKISAARSLKALSKASEFAQHVRAHLDADCELHGLLALHHSRHGGA